MTSLKQIGVALGCNGLISTILYVYPELMNTMVVKIMNAQSDVPVSMSDESMALLLSSLSDCSGSESIQCIVAESTGLCLE